MIALAYDLAKFWGIDPQTRLALPLSRLIDESRHAARILDDMRRVGRS